MLLSTCHRQFSTAMQSLPVPPLHHVLGLLLVVLATSGLLAWLRHHWAPRPPQTAASKTGPRHDAYWAVEPLDGFDWASTPPEKLRPFKPRFYMTMAVRDVDMSDLIAIDREFLERIRLRRQILAQNPSSSAQASAASGPAVRELYEFLAGHFLPRRFPTLFALGERSVRNRASGDVFPLAAPDPPVAALRALASLVDEDFILLLPPPPGAGPEYVVHAWVVCFASGFALPPLLGKTLSFAHAKVPGYAEKLRASMTRWFDRLEVGRVVRRCNWTITMHGNLRNEEGQNQLYEEEASRWQQDADVDMSKVHLRTELQHLHRLPRSRAIVFTYKTYLYSLADVKAEGQGEALAQAIEGLSKGNVPDMARYKRGTVWGEAVCNYLRC